jgi:hypothetical protein
VHVYFTGSDQRNGHLPAHHLDFRSVGGYILAPPSRYRGRAYQPIKTLDGHGGLDWQAVIRLLEPDTRPSGRLIVQSQAAWLPKYRRHQEHRVQPNRPELGRRPRPDRPSRRLDPPLSARSVRLDTRGRR